MKKFLLLFGIFICILPSSGAVKEFTTLGNGTVYTFESLSAIDSSGITKQGGAYIVSKDFTLSSGDTLRIINGDTIKICNKVKIEIAGFADFTPSDTALITRDAIGSEPKGFRVRGDNAGAKLRNLRIEYIGIGVATKNGHIDVDNCTFDSYLGKLTSSSCLSFGSSSEGNTVRNSTFSNGVSAAIGNGANTPVGILIDNCIFDKNGTNKRNYPQLNITCAKGYKATITNNVVTGIGENTKAGGICVSNMMGYSVMGEALIEGNRVVNNRYGIAMVGPVDVKILNNYLYNNIYDSNALTGGEAISFTDNLNKGKAYIEGNHIEGHLWGITIIGAPSVNAGKVANPLAEDYNPGNNVFVNNGNGGKLYDMYNNGKGTVYAQGNLWNVAVQDSASIEQVVFHKSDVDSLGLVIFMPPYQTTGLAKVNSRDDVVSVRYFNAQGQALRGPERGLMIIVTRYGDGRSEPRKVMF